MQFIITKKDHGGFLLWLSTFLISLFIIIIMVTIKNKRNISLKLIIILVISNLFVGFILFLLAKPFRLISFELFLRYLFCVGIVFFTGNWILPVLFITVTKVTTGYTQLRVQGCQPLNLRRKDKHNEVN
jgi:hypothetical protein